MGCVGHTGRCPGARACARKGRWRAQRQTQTQTQATQTIQWPCAQSGQRDQAQCVSHNCCSCHTQRSAATQRYSLNLSKTLAHQHGCNQCGTNASALVSKTQGAHASAACGIHKQTMTQWRHGSVAVLGFHLGRSSIMLSKANLVAIAVGGFSLMVLTKSAYAYKVKKICEDVMTKRGTVEKCRWVREKDSLEPSRPPAKNKDAKK